MKAFWKILLGGSFAFMALAIAQEWDFFSSAWFGKNTPAPVLSEAQKSHAADAVYGYLKMTSHLYGSGGDPRFAERIRAAAPLVAETLADVDYLRRNGRVQDPVLVKMEPLSADAVGTGVVLKTKEFWVTRTFRVGSDQETDPPRSEIVFAKYSLEPDGKGWKVVSWDFNAPPRGVDAEAAQGGEATTRPVP